ncbi:unnamed protein product [Boreogadus saida]
MSPKRATSIFAEARAQRCPGSEDGDGSRDKPSIESPHQPLGAPPCPPTPICQPYTHSPPPWDLGAHTPRSAITHRGNAFRTADEPPEDSDHRNAKRLFPERLSPTGSVGSIHNAAPGPRFQRAVQSQALPNAAFSHSFRYRAVTGNTARPQSCATEMERYGESC